MLYIIPRCLGQKETSVFKKNKQREFVRSEHMKSPRFCVLGHLLYQTEKRRTNNERKLQGNTNQCHRRKAGVNLSVISKWKVNTWLFTNDWTFHIGVLAYLTLLGEYWLSLQLAPIKTIQIQILLILGCPETPQTLQSPHTVYHVSSSRSPRPSQTSFQQPRACVKTLNKVFSVL